MKKRQFHWFVSFVLIWIIFYLLRFFVCFIFFYLFRFFYFYSSFLAIIILLIILIFSTPKIDLVSSSNRLFWTMISWRTWIWIKYVRSLIACTQFNMRLKVSSSKRVMLVALFMSWKVSLQLHYCKQVNKTSKQKLVALHLW